MLRNEDGISVPTEGVGEPSCRVLALGCGQGRVQSPVLNNKIGIREELVGSFPSVLSLEDAAFAPLHLSAPFAL